VLISACRGHTVIVDFEILNPFFQEIAVPLAVRHALAGSERIAEQQDPPNALTFLLLEGAIASKTLFVCPHKVSTAIMRHAALHVRYEPKPYSRMIFVDLPHDA
jgi:hypothetical protein